MQVRGLPEGRDIWLPKHDANTLPGIFRKLELLSLPALTDVFPGKKPWDHGEYPYPFSRI